MKKKVPLEILQKIQPLIDQYPNLITLVPDTSVIFKFKDADPDSVFHFTLVERNESTWKYILTYAPSSTYNVSETSSETDANKICEIFESWIINLKTYNELNTIFDDPAQKSYQKYYYDNYQIVDEDAEYAPFDPPRVLYLEEHLEAVKEFVEKNVELFKDPADAESIKASCDELIEELTVSPKNTVMKKLTNIWAKISKGGTKLMKKFLTEFGSELKKKLIEEGVTTITKYLSDHGGDIIDTVSSVIS